MSKAFTKKIISWAVIAAMLAPGAAPVYAATAAPAKPVVNAYVPTQNVATNTGDALVEVAPAQKKFTPKFSLRDAKSNKKSTATAADSQHKSLAVGAATQASIAQSAPDAPGAADLQETEEIVLSPAVRALAASLNNSPVQIFNWVHNNIDYVPTYGSIQGSEMALQTRRANDIDTASLLIALYRAAGIPARYGQGTIEISGATAMNWVGGVTTPESALALLTQSGIPATSVVQGGSIAALRVGHVWVEAYVDFYPSRGAINKTPTTWVPVDASLKQSTYANGLDLRTGVTLNTSSYISQLQQGATLNSADNSATSLNRVAATGSYSAYQNNVTTYVNAQRPNATVGDVLGTKTVVAENHPILIGTLPYKTVGQSTRFASVPDTLRWKFRYSLYASYADRAQDTPVVFVQRSVPALAGKRISLAFVPATATDAQNLSSALASSSLPTSLPGYQYHLKAQLKLDGQMIGEGGSYVMGTALSAVSSVFDPAVGAWQAAAPHQPSAGETIALAVAPQGVSAEQLAASRDRLSSTKTKLDAHQFIGLTAEEVTAEPLYFGALAYAATVESNARISQRAFKVAGAALPSVVRVSTRNEATFAAGIPQNVRFAGVALDVDTYSQLAVSIDNTAGAARDFQRVVGERASVFGHLMLEKLFTDAQHTGEAASTLKTLARANEAGQKLFVVTPANSAATLALVTASTDVKNQLDAGARAGKQGLVHQSALTLGAWNGSGYLVEDTATGSGSYEVQGQLTAVLYPPEGWSALSLAGPALSAGNGNPVTDGMSTILGQAIGSYSSLSALLGDYRSASWSTFAGAGAYTSSLWLAVSEQPLRAQLGEGFGSLGLSLAANSVTSLTGAPLANSPPTFTTTAITVGSVGQPYKYLASAVDPESDPITYSMTGAPAGMGISSNGLVSWPTPVRGTYAIALRASDGHAFTEQRFALTISDVLPLAITLLVTPQYSNVGDTITLTVVTTGGRGNVTRSLAVDGQTVTLDTNGQAKITNAAMGPHQAVASATDSDGTVTKRTGFGVRNASDTTPPVVEVLSPAMGSEIRKPVDIVGNASDATLVEWQVLVSPAGQARYTLIAQGNTSVTGAVVARFDPTQLANGQWDVLLRAVDANGQESSDRVTYEVMGDLKIGQFSVSFRDLSIDAAGIPVSVTRTYDTRRKNDSLDYGFGWTVDYQNVRVQKNLTSGIGWEVYTQGLLNTCIRPIGKRTISIALPDGKLHRFDVGASPQCANGSAPAAFSPTFTPRADTTSTLADTVGGSLSFQGDTVYDLDGGPYNPTQFTLTTIEGFVYTLDQGFGIKSVKEPNGNTLTFGPNGIVHSNGVSITFARDTTGRITSITDPNGKSINYAYNDSGDLISVTDRTNATSVMTYNSSHGLLTFTDPRGIQLAKNEYDAEGRLVAQYDATGAKLDLSARDIPGQKETVKDRRGNTTVYEYDSSGNVTRVTDALGGVTAYTYDAQGNELSKKDANGFTNTRTVDLATGSVYSETDALNHTTGYAYNLVQGSNGPSPNSISSVTDAKGNVTNFDYDPLGNPRSIKDATGVVTAMQWNSGNLMTLTDAAGNATNFQYDSQGKRVKEIDATGAATSYTYDANGNVLTTTKSRTINGATVTLATNRTLDADGNVLSETDPAGGVTLTTYNALKKIATSTDPAGRVTRYDYDERGNQTRVNYADGTYEQSTLDANGNETVKTDLAGRATTTEYDALNRATKVIYADNTSVTNVYDAGGRATQTTDERGNVSKFEYDAAGHRTKVTDALNNSTLSAYDANGNITSLTDALGNVTSFEYDAANRRTKTILPAINAVTNNVTVEYDAVGRKIRETDEAGNLTQFGYDKLGRLTQATDAADGITAYGYDEVGNKISQTDAKGHITKWEYDNLGRVTKRTLPEGMSEIFAFNAAGNLERHTDFNGKATAYTYDSQNRMLSRTYSVTSPAGVTADTTIAMTYTASGQVATIVDSNGTITHTYDNRDRLTKVENPDGSVLDYTYDAAGNRASVATRYGIETPRVVTYEYDAVNRLSRVTGSANLGSEVTSYTYDALGNIQTVVRPNGTTDKNSYDARGRLTQIDTIKSADQSLLARFSYTLSAHGLRSQVVEVINTVPPQTRTVAYTYDALKRLTAQATTGASSGLDLGVSYIYDAVGNRTQAIETQSGTTVTTAYTYDNNDRLLTENQSGGVTLSNVYSYDINGNQTAKTTTQGGVTTVTGYQWQKSGMPGEDRLVLFTPNTGAGTAGSVSYKYDAEGNRLVKANGTDPNAAVATDTTRFLVDKNKTYADVIEERDGNKQANVYYTYGLRLLSQTRYLGATGTESQLHQDGLGSTRLMTTSNAAITNSNTYKPYGDIQNQTGSTPYTYLFAGEQFDSTLGLYYNRARYMSPVMGRFVSADPWGGMELRPTTLNKYLYANANPISNVDPSGWQSLAELGEAENVQGTLSTAASNISKNALDIARKAKIFDIYDYVELGLRPFNFHFYMYADRPSTRTGTRYDVGNDVGWKGILKQRNPFGVLPGGYVEAKSVFNRRGIDGKGKKIVSLSFGQWLSWHLSVVGTEETSCRIELNYSLTPGVGSNCLSWTIWGTIKAIAASRLPL